MNKKVDFPVNAHPISSELLNSVQNFSHQDLFWLSGYCSGLAEGRKLPISGELAAIDRQILPDGDVDIVTKTLLIYASQTGNAKKVAESLSKALAQSSIPVELIDVAELKYKNLLNYKVILLVTSTHGEGEAPDDAIEFLEYVNSKRAPELKNTQHAILGLGDSSYEFYCQTGKDFEQALLKMGSVSLLDRVDCDLDYQVDVGAWIERVSEALAKISTLNKTNSSNPKNHSINVSEVGEYSRNNPFEASILLNQRITGQDSRKKVHHIEISLKGSGIQYLPGDSLGVWAKNNTDLVDELLSLTQLDGEKPVLIKQTEKTLKQALIENLEITLLNKDFIKNYSKLVELVNVERAENLINVINLGYSSYIKSSQVVDVISLAPIALQAQQLVDLLKPIKPRMYSIASSLDANPDEVHLTVALKQTNNEKGKRLGAASHFLIETLKEDEQVLVYVEENKRFRLPQGKEPVIMIGPGTGIAPFRAFIQQRIEENSSGENWLFFGEQHFNTDFLYQLEMQKYHKQGVLSRLDVAFSRDQKDKIYVQHRLMENAKLVWQWLNEKNAYLYICGDMSHMAKDVEQVLLEIICEQGSQSFSEAQTYLKKLKKENRYQRDVY